MANFDRLILTKKFMYVAQTKNLEMDRCPSKENIFGHSALLINAMYMILPKGEL